MNVLTLMRDRGLFPLAQIEPNVPVVFETISNACLQLVIATLMSKCY
jgi:hypothetical protein